MSVHIMLRLSLAFILAVVGWASSLTMSHWISLPIPVGTGFYRLLITFFGAVLGFFIAPIISVVPYRVLRKHLGKMPARDLIMGIMGLAVGLFIAALLAIPFSLLPDMWGHISPLVVAIFLGTLGAMIMVMRHDDILPILGAIIGGEDVRRKRNVVLLDTSVIIDGRVADIRHTGFIRGTMVVPRFVLDELQHIADSPDILRRNRGRRGLDILNKMQKDENIPLEISERDVPEVREVDAKLIKLAQELSCPILTNDYNLNRVAELQGIAVLNINELANAVKAAVLPGETLRVQIIQEGKEIGQGVGYLDDGTMIVVEDGRRSMNNSVEVTVTRVLQTVAGRMIFGQIPDNKR